MFIAFEGPDEVGKSTSARLLTTNHEPIYNATKDNYEGAKRELATATDDFVQAFDRIDWLTHLVYRLSMPEKEWNDERVRTVFAMPDTHLVIKFHPLHQPTPVAEGEGYNVDLSARVNEGYYHLVDYISGMNMLWNFPLFKTVTAVEVVNDQETGEFTQTLRAFVAPGLPWGSSFEPLVHDDASLLELLRYADERIG